MSVSQGPLWLVAGAGFERATSGVTARVQPRSILPIVDEVEARAIAAAGIKITIGAEFRCGNGVARILLAPVLDQDFLGTSHGVAACPTCGPDKPRGQLLALLIDVLINAEIGRPFFIREDRKDTCRSDPEVIVYARETIGRTLAHADSRSQMRDYLD